LPVEGLGSSIPVGTWKPIAMVDAGITAYHLLVLKIPSSEGRPSSLHHITLQRNPRHEGHEKQWKRGLRREEQRLVEGQ
jgi:hypothetical protein